ncbi:MAG: sulfatase-like hydrolase/transferase [Pseudomonadota bacterium]
MRIQALLIMALLLCTHAHADRPPNVVLLIGDDHGYPYFGFMGDDNVVTPTMDALAAGGVTFTQGHVTVPYCRPSLRTMITGLHPVEYQMQLNRIIDRRKRSARFDDMSEDEQRRWTTYEKAAAMQEFDTLPKLLREKGYVSWQGGKWWENSYRNAHFDEGMTDGWEPDAWGRDDFFFQLMGADGTKLVRETMDPLFDFIDRHQQQPMFIWFGPSLPHTPLDAPYKYQKYYADKKMSESAKLYYANITWWDDGVGRLMDYMQSKNLLDDTLFIYISDNGWEQDADAEYWHPGADYTTDPLFANGGQRGKNALYDLSFRSPFIFYWKDRLSPSRNESSLVSAMDLVPTILDLAGRKVPQRLRGRSLRPLLDGDGEYQEREHMVSYNDNRRSKTQMMGQQSEGYVVRTRRWHFFWYADTGEMRLYDVTSDPWGDTDQSEARPKLVAQFKQSIADWKKSIGMREPIAIHE